ncbi:capsular polysaccharide biosynthesis protein [Levilactobacillus koreensis JCM 16448]|uniref:Tyrosine-protein phosphatase n=1 Tax=Levilactobacillus koreensis TaxID=637971 RepID=A0AAC8ZGV2_9LACO|nr:CpsB/CapC family capsule biosynthesis tyrosine phosphatase [Levilactobacillus koreensis]AKP65338.1 tyrosine protein phosphatase [Levilactobacillus koreensis]KRK86077.1 capsular polysaccharide biosynthesis protein [Levilactobacillus koreensis JCM 16448]
MDLIDLHCHILPGVDDGSKNMDMSLEMSKDAVKQGITHILLTPHHMDGEYTNHKVDVIRKTGELQNELNDAGIPLTVFPGQEVHLTGDLLKALDDDDILFMDETNRYLLLEFPHSGIPEYTEDMIFELMARGITPVLAHPERNHGFQKDPDRLYDFVQMGCLTQLTSSSYLGVFGDSVEKLTEKIIKSGLGFVFSSDAHNFKGRRFLMADAFQKLIKKEGLREAELFNDNAKSIINGETIAVPHIQKISTVHRKWGFKLF